MTSEHKSAQEWVEKALGGCRFYPTGDDGDTIVGMNKGQLASLLTEYAEQRTAKMRGALDKLQNAAQDHLNNTNTALTATTRHYLVAAIQDARAALKESEE